MFTVDLHTIINSNKYLLTQKKKQNTKNQSKKGKETQRDYSFRLRSEPSEKARRRTPI